MAFILALIYWVILLELCFFLFFLFWSRLEDGPEVIMQLHSLERRMDRVETKVGRLETEHVLQGWNGYEELNQKMLN